MNVFPMRSEQPHEGQGVTAKDMPETEINFTVRKSPEGGYEARAVSHSIFTQADTMDELEANVREAVRCHFGDEKPLPAIHLETWANGRVLGSAKGEFRVPDDFNDPLPKEIEDEFYK